MFHGFQSRLLVFGWASITVGVLLLLWTLGIMPAAGVFWPALAIIVGLLMLRAVFFGSGRESYAFSGLFLTLGGALVMLMNTTMSRFTLERIWPVFMTITGLSLAGYALRKAPVHRLSLLIPACTIIVLSLVFLVFSLDLVDADFILFVAAWWPTIFIIAGAVLVALHLRRR